MILIFSFNILLRLIFTFYGYIATEEGMLLYNQQLAYSGQLPFIDYDAWTSLFHDYLLGWHQFLLGTSILMQRLVGLTLALVVFWLTVKLARRLNPKSTHLVALLLTLGSPLYLYFSTIPYSEQFMTLFITLSLFCLVTNRSALAFLSSIAAGLIRSQALPVTFLVWIYLFFIQPRRSFLNLSLVGAGFALVLLSPFLLISPSHVIWAFFWPLKASQTLIYQQGFQGVNLSHLVNFTLEATRDYGLLTAIITAGLAVFGWPNKLYRRFYILTLGIILSQLAVALIHQPPYASYLYPFVPLLALWAGFYLSRTLKFTRILITLLLLTNFIIFPHAQFIKTSLASLSTTPHELLQQISSYLTRYVSPEDEILSFYIPIVTQANRRLPPNLNRGSGSLSFLSTSQAQKHHLTNLDMLTAYLKSSRPAAVVFTSKDLVRLTPDQRSVFLASVESYYYLAQTFSQISQIEDPRTRNLFIYLPLASNATHDY